MTVPVLLAVLVFHGCVHVKRRRCKHSGQESSTEYRYCHARLSHRSGDAIGHRPRSQTHQCAGRTDSTQTSSVKRGSRVKLPILRGLLSGTSRILGAVN